MSLWNRAVPSAAEQRELKKDALLRQAAYAFRTNGYHGTSLSDIADSLGISKPTLYYYVKNKQDLLYQCHLAASEQALDSICRDASLNALDRICRTITDYVRSTISDDSYSVIILEEKSLSKQQFEDVVRRRDQFQSAVIRIIREGVEEGSIMPCEPKFGAFCVLGTANWVSKWYRRGESWSLDEISAAIGDFVRSSLSPKPVRGADRAGSLAGGVAGDLMGNRSTPLFAIMADAPF